MSTYLRASHVPLFDRLCMPDPALPQGRLLAGRDLQESLRRDLQRLLNTRNGQTIDQFLDGQGSVLQYGLPDVGGLSALSDSDLEVLARVVAHGIRLYEPRLSGAIVTARPDFQRPGHVWLSIAGSAVIAQVLQRVDFEMTLDDPAAQVLAAA